MPDYLYSCGEHRQRERHRMLYSTAVLCGECGNEMHRVPQAFAVTWGGLPPSSGERHPDVQAAIDNVDERRERVEQKWRKRNGID